MSRYDASMTLELTTQSRGELAFGSEARAPEQRREAKQQRLEERREAGAV